MCYLLIAKKLKEKVSKANQDVIKAIAMDNMTVNNDGFGLYTPKDKIMVRTLNAQAMKARLNVADMDASIFHARFATTGEVSQDNVHNYEKDGYIFAHNGGISDYADKSIWKEGKYTKAEQDHTDSKLFFYDLLDEIKARTGTGHKTIAKAIQAMVQEVTFWGRASLYDKENDRLFLFGDWHTYKLADEFVIISSADLGKPADKKTTIRGLKFEDNKNSSFLCGELDGINVIKNFSKDNWNLKYLMALKDYSAEKVCNTTRAYMAFDYQDKLPVNVSTPLPDNLPACVMPKFRTHTLPVTTEYHDDMPDEGYIYKEELFNIFGQLVDVYEDETGVHDVTNDCCNYNTCGLFYDDIKEANEMARAEFGLIGEDVSERTPEEKQGILDHLQAEAEKMTA